MGKIAAALAREPGQTFANVLVRKGPNLSPALAITAGTRSVYVVVTRDNWPAEGCVLSALWSFDGGNTYSVGSGPLLVMPFEPTPKEPNPTPAEIGVAWGDAGPQPTHARLSLNNQSDTGFRADFRLDVG